jgi:hypothetical protein
LSKLNEEDDVALLGRFYNRNKFCKLHWVFMSRVISLLANALNIYKIQS